MTVVLLAGVAPPGTAFRVTLDDSFPAEVRRDLQTLAGDCLAACRQLWPGKPPAGERPIVLSIRAAGPLTDSTSDPKTYRIYVTVKTRAYAQFVYQFSHEFAHVMLDPRRTNGLVETFAVAFSLAALDAMAVRWRDRAPYASWVPYAPYFRKYRREAEQRHLKTFPLDVQALVERKSWEELALYLRYRRADQDADINNRNLNHLGAAALRSGEVKWQDLLGLAGHTDPPADRDGRFRADLQIDPRKLPGLVRRLGRNREGDMVAVELDHKPGGRSGVFQLGARRWLYLHEAPAIDGKALGKIMEEMKPAALWWERGMRP
jgi:hypothetical protein